MVIEAFIVFIVTILPNIPRSLFTLLSSEMMLWEGTTHTIPLSISRYSNLMMVLISPDLIGEALFIYARRYFSS